MATTDSPAGPSSASASSSTIYINNLNEKVKLPILKTSLRSLFSTYGQLLSITAHANIRLRGQAFIAFADPDAASKAAKEVNGFPLYGKSMQCALAKTPSDSVLLASQPRNSPVFKEHKTARRSRRVDIKALSAQGKKQGLANGALAGGIGGKRKRGAGGEDEDEGEGQDGGHTGVGIHGSGTRLESATTTRRAIPQLPDEYLPPNALLFIQNLPEDNSVTREELEKLFVSDELQGLREVRMIPGKAIAFVEYATAELATRAREVLNGRKVGSQIGQEGEEVKGLRITFARV